MKLEKYYENPQILHVGTEPNRAYYIPFNKDKLDRYHLLSGTDWLFAFYPSVTKVPEHFQDLSEIDYDTIHVPSCWNMLGYEKNHYSNFRLPIPFDPPYVPQENPCGTYIKTFEVSAEAMGYRSYLNFEGVDSAFYVWVNGVMVGYSQVAHCTSEFEITDFIHQGENKLAVLVLKWSDGTYLEDQDKFRMSGIFRDVYILQRPAAFIRDFTVHTTLLNDKQAVVKVDLEWEGVPKDVVAYLETPDKQLKMTGTVEADTIHFEVQDAMLWNAETPYLYELRMQAGDESIVQQVGIREVTIEHSIIKLNGEPIKFKGVNRHDSDPYTGATISKEQLIKDLELMKTHNVNAIRTSHYPNAPWAMDLYNQYGFYIMDEADIETHQTVQLYGGGHHRTYDEEICEDLSFGLLCHDPRFKEAMVDRVQRCVIRDKNAPSVIMWSLGNEAGYGPNMEAAMHWVKGYDSSRLLHYESSIYQMTGYTNDLSGIDIYSRMYAPVHTVAQYCEQEPKRPMVLCEYGHTMGNSGGDLEQYFEVMYAYPEMAGGFVWEWCDHAVCEIRDGKECFLYGGDFDEPLHDGNFCIDGMIYPDRRPHTALLEYKNIARPFRIRKIAEDTYECWNTMDFLSSDEAFDIRYTVTKGQQIIEQGNVPLKGVAPHCKEVFHLPVQIEGDDDYTLLFETYQKQATPLVPQEDRRGFDQIILQKAKRVEDTKMCKGALGWVEDDLFITIEGKNFKYVFDKQQGTPTKMTYEDITVTGLHYNIWRAPTDNDRQIKLEWFKVGYDRAMVRVYDYEIVQDETGITCIVSIGMNAVGVQPILKATATWKVTPEGNVQLTIEGKQTEYFPFLPRFGIRFFLEESMTQVSYKGYGPEESYCDKHHASIWGWYESTVSEMHEDYVKPQENSSHWGCSYIKLADEQGKQVVVEGIKDFSANVSYYTQEELAAKEHHFELEPSGQTVVCIDGQMSGIGSNSCGPQLAPQFRVDGSGLTLNVAFSFNK